MLDLHNLLWMEIMCMFNNNSILSPDHEMCFVVFITNLHLDLDILGAVIHTDLFKKGWEEAAESQTYCWLN